MKQVGQEREGDTNLPRFYRWLLKIPLPDYFGLLEKLPLLAGSFVYSLTLCGLWILVILPLPILVFTYPFVGFPLNVILGLSIPAIVTMFWARIQVERVLILWKSMQIQRSQGNIEKMVTEYVELINRRRKRRKK